MPELQIENHTLHWHHEIKKNLKHSYIVLKPEGITLRSPRISQAEAEAILRSKARWIIKKLNVLEPYQAPRNQEIEAGMQVYILGQAYRLAFSSHDTQPLIRAYLEGEQLVLQMPERCLAQATLREELLQTFLRQEARLWMNKRLEYWSEALQLYPREVRYKRHKRRWGSCTANNQINLNYRAIQLPGPCIDSILVHELAHIRHKNHGRHFWDLVYRFVPNYKELDQEIKTLAYRLL
jgi:predicted metal-dependent hydrolase